MLEDALMHIARKRVEQRNALEGPKFYLIGISSVAPNIGWNSISVSAKLGGGGKDYPQYINFDVNFVEWFLTQWVLEHNAEGSVLD